MIDKPDAAELLEAVAAFLEHEVVPAFEGRPRFHALVAANVVRLTTRELRLGSERLVAEIADLRALLGRSGESPAGASEHDLAVELARELCRRIGAGEMDEGESYDGVVAYLRRSIGRRLDVDNPKFSR